MTDQNLPGSAVSANETGHKQMIPTKIQIKPAPNFEVEVHCDSVDCLFNLANRPPPESQQTMAACNLKRHVIADGVCQSYTPTDCEGRPVPNESMRPFLLFAWSSHVDCPAGGWYDFINGFRTKEAALEWVNQLVERGEEELGFIMWGWQIVDIRKREVIKQWCGDKNAN